MVEPLDRLDAGHVDAKVGAGEAIDTAIEIHGELLIRDLDGPFGATVFADLPPFALTSRAEFGVDHGLVARQRSVEVHLTPLARPADTDVLDRCPVSACRMSLEVSERQHRVGIGNGAGHELLRQVVSSPFEIDKHVVGSEPAVGNHDRTADGTLVEAVSVCRFEVVHRNGPTDPGVIGHGRRVGDKRARSLFLQQINQRADDHGPQIADVVSLAHVGLDRYDIPPFQVVQPTRMLQNLSCLYSR